MARCGSGWVMLVGMAFLTFGCGGRITPGDEHSADDLGQGDGGTGGARTAMGGTSSGSGSAGSPGVGSGDTGGASSSGVAGSGSGPGGCLGPDSPGGSGGMVGGCALPWWGTPLEGVRGLTECSVPYHPAMLAYGQTVLPSCWVMSGPVSSTPGANLECCYHFDERACCGSSYQGTGCITVPYFGPGTAVVTVPEDPAPSAEQLCGQPHAVSASAPSIERAAEQLTGLWLACGSMPQPFQGRAFLFQGDGTFDVLDVGEDGEFVSAPGCLQGGLWGFLASTGQLNLHMEDWSQFQHPTFAEGTVQRLYLETFEFVKIASPYNGIPPR